MICGNCGFDNPDECRFCINCGSPISLRTKVNEPEEATPAREEKITNSDMEITASAEEKAQAVVAPAENRKKPAANDKASYTIAGFVCGITAFVLSLICCSGIFLFPFSLTLSAFGIYFSVKGRKTESKKGLALAGIILSALGATLSFFLAVAAFIALIGADKMSYAELLDYINNL